MESDLLHSVPTPHLPPLPAPILLSLLIFLWVIYLLISDWCFLHIHTGAVPCGRLPCAHNMICVKTFHISSLPKPLRPLILLLLH